MQQQLIPLCWCYWCIVKKLITDSLTHSEKLKMFWFYIHIKSVFTRAILFGSNKHQIVQRLGLRPRPHCMGELTDPLALKGRGMRGRGREGKGRREGGEWKGGCLLLNLSLATPLITSNKKSPIHGVQGVHESTSWISLFSVLLRTSLKLIAV